MATAFPNAVAYVQNARRPQAAAERLLIYDVRCTMYDLDYSAPRARAKAPMGRLVNRT